MLFHQWHLFQRDSKDHFIFSARKPFLRSLFARFSQIETDFGVTLYRLRVSPTVVKRTHHRAAFVVFRTLLHSRFFVAHFKSSKIALIQRVRGASPSLTLPVSEP